MAQAVHCSHQGGPGFTHISLCRIDDEQNGTKTTFSLTT